MKLPCGGKRSKNRGICTTEVHARRCHHHKTQSLIDNESNSDIKRILFHKDGSKEYSITW